MENWDLTHRRTERMLLGLALIVMVTLLGFAGIGYLADPAQARPNCDAYLERADEMLSRISRDCCLPAIGKATIAAAFMQRYDICARFGK